MAPLFARAYALWPLWVAATLALAACAGPAPLSGSRLPATTVPAPAPAPQPAPLATIRPAPEVQPPEAVPAPPQATRPTTDTIVLVLPLESSLYGRAAEAVR